MKEDAFEPGYAQEAGGSRRGLEVCGAGIPDRNRMAKGRETDTGTWMENMKSYFWTVCWVKFGKGHWYPDMQCLVKESGLNSESSEEPL